MGSEALDHEAPISVPVMYRSGTWIGVVRASSILLLIIAVTTILRMPLLGVARPELIVVAILIIVGWERRNEHHVGLRFDARGVELRYWLRTVRLGVGDIDHFELSGSSAGSIVVRLVPVRGRKRRVPGIALAQWGPFRTNEVLWDGGRTGDVISRLDGQLAWGRTASASDEGGQTPR